MRTLCQSSEERRQNVREALGLFLDEHHVSYLAILTRVKEFESFFDKCAAKNYSNPFMDNTDFVGLRIILYFPKDIFRVTDIIETEFDVIASEDKAEAFEINEFGYWSHHMLVRVKQDWLATPNYRGLDDLTIEIQIRTVLMHAWGRDRTQIAVQIQRAGT